MHSRIKRRGLGGPGPSCGCMALADLPRDGANGSETHVSLPTLPNGRIDGYRA
jgi:hypothetical protein